MALDFERQTLPDIIPPGMLRNQDVYQALKDQNREPILMRSDTLVDTAAEEVTVVVFIPPTQSMEVSIADAREMASIRAKLSGKKQHPGA